MHVHDRPSAASCLPPWWWLVDLAVLLLQLGCVVALGLVLFYTVINVSLSYARETPPPPGKNAHFFLSDEMFTSMPWLLWDRMGWIRPFVAVFSPSQFRGTPDCNESAALHSHGTDAHCR